MARKPPRKTYDSPIRRKRADKTHLRILSAAQGLFTTRGYAATSIANIAERAGSSEPSIYAIFGSKRGIVRALVAAAKERAQVPSRFAQLLGAPDGSSKLRISAAITRAYSESSGDLLDAVRSATAADRDAGKVWAQAERSRYVGQRTLTDSIPKQELRSDLSSKRAADVLWTLSSHDVYRLLVTERGWTADEFQAWLVDTTRRLLLRDP